MDPGRWRHIEQLYHGALARPPAERGAFLAEACAGDSALQGEIESLLRQPASEGKFLAAPAVAGLTDPGVLIVRGRIEPGSMLGTYRIQSLLGRGGMGEVYRARDTKLGRDVAIKVIPEGFLSDAERVARFEREARLQATLNHPHIRAIYGLEETDLSTASRGTTVRALVLELVEGVMLAERLASGPLPVPEALTVARQIAEALDAAHEKGIVHRDLKPGNVK